jgi:hypothetical protein
VERCLALVLRSPAQPDEGGCAADRRRHPSLFCVHNVQRRYEYVHVAVGLVPRPCVENAGKPRTTVPTAIGLVPRPREGSRSTEIFTAFFVASWHT